MLKLLLKRQIVYILHILHEFLQFKVTRYIFIGSNSTILYLFITKITKHKLKIDFKIGYKMVCRPKVSFEVMSTPVIFFHFVALATTRSDIQTVGSLSVCV